MNARNVVAGILVLFLFGAMVANKCICEVEPMGTGQTMGVVAYLAPGSGPVSCAIEVKINEIVYYVGGSVPRERTYTLAADSVVEIRDLSYDAGIWQVKVDGVLCETEGCADQEFLMDEDHLYEIWYEAI